MSVFMGRSLAIMLAIICCAATVGAADSTSLYDLNAQADAKAATLTMYGVEVVTLRATVLSHPPEHRAEVMKDRITYALQNLSSGWVTSTPLLNGTMFMIDGNPTVFLAPSDLTPSNQLHAEAYYAEVRKNIRLVVDAWNEQHSVSDLLINLGIVAFIVSITLVLVRFILFAKKRLTRKAMRMLSRHMQRRGIREIARSSRFVVVMVVRLLSTVSYLLVGVALYLATTLSLSRFPITRSIGMEMSKLLTNGAMSIANEIVSVLPNIVSLILLFLVARFASRWVSRILVGVEKNQYSLPGIDKDTVLPTKRIVVTLIWVFTLAFAYPLIPGSSSQAFQGVSVLFGLMLSLGASSTIGQAMSGLVLLYSRSLRVGDYVTIGEVSGSVIRLGFFAVRIRNAYQQEITIPNGVLVTSTITNHTRLTHSGTTYTNTVTIGYDAPWRLIHEMLLEATRRVEFIDHSSSAPYVTQTSLSDFYVEYRLTCVFTKPEIFRATVSALHGAIQDVFNENGIQIMSPHYEADPDAPKLVSPHLNSVELRQTAHPNVPRDKPEHGEPPMV